MKKKKNQSTTKTSLAKVQPQNRHPEVKRTKDRRTEIVHALHECIRKSGYAETRLSDLAKSSKLSVSHLLYYFPSKEAVLEKLCHGFLDGLFAEFVRYGDTSPKEQLDLLINQFFPREEVEAASLGLGLELIGLSMHRPTIFQIMRLHNREMMRYLTDLFSKLPRRRGVTAEEAARIAAGLRVGLFTNGIFDDELDRETARKIFRRSMYELAGMRE